jgi:hypothetical protein
MSRDNLEITQSKEAPMQTNTQSLRSHFLSDPILAAKQSIPVILHFFTTKRLVPSLKLANVAASPTGNDNESNHVGAKKRKLGEF